MAITAATQFCAAANPKADKVDAAKSSKPLPSAKAGPAGGGKESGADAASVARGKVLFEKATCAGCHPGGNNMLFPTRPIKGPEFQAKYKTDQQLADTIRVGFRESGMPSFPKEKISDKDLKDLISYVRSLTPKRN